VGIVRTRLSLEVVDLRETAIAGAADKSVRLDMVAVVAVEGEHLPCAFEDAGTVEEDAMVALVRSGGMSSDETRVTSRLSAGGVTVRWQEGQFRRGDDLSVMDAAGRQSR
jgi:hypothetical protein